ncbi:MAG: hypothetical protein RI993_1878, partial [Pseudomonadota bacterium]
TCPIVPTFTCGLLRSNLLLAMFYPSHFNATSTDIGIPSLPTRSDYAHYVHIAITKNKNVVPMARIELAASPLPRECSTTELHGQTTPIFTSFSSSGAGEGNRTLVVSLEGFCSTIELHPLITFFVIKPLFSLLTNSTPTEYYLTDIGTTYMVEGEGFEPSKAEPSDLQSDPFDRSGTPPK